MSSSEGLKPWLISQRYCEVPHWGLKKQRFLQASGHSCGLPSLHVSDAREIEDISSRHVQGKTVFPK